MDRLTADIPAQILDVFRDGFALPQAWTLAQSRHAMVRSDVLGLLVNAHAQVFAYAFYSIPPETLFGKHVLWEDAICIRQALQGQGYASEALIHQVCSHFPEYNFGWLGGRTQNPQIFRRYAHFGALYPFDQSYAEGSGPFVLAFLRQHITEVNEDWLRTDPLTGICKNIYPEGRLGNYTIDLEKHERFEQMLNNWGFERSAGDAVIVVAQSQQVISIG